MGQGPSEEREDSRESQDSGSSQDLEHEQEPEPEPEPDPGHEPHRDDPPPEDHRDVAASSENGHRGVSPAASVGSGAATPSMSASLSGSGGGAPPVTPPAPSLSRLVAQLVSEPAPMFPAAGPKQIETVPTQFVWARGGNEVFVTGSFNEWQGKIRMGKTETGEFALVLNIPPGHHQYKYIVDDEWRLNPDAATVEDQGVINNTVEVKRAMFEDNSIQFADSDDEGHEEFDDEGKKLTYGQKARVADAKVPKMPPHLKYPLPDVAPPPPPADRFQLPVPDHVILNHVCLYDPASDAEKTDLLVTAVTQRFKTKPFASLRSKFVTTIYYAPKPEEKDLERAPIGPGDGPAVAGEKTRKAFPGGQFPPGGRSPRGGAWVEK